MKNGYIFETFSNPNEVFVIIHDPLHELFADSRGNDLLLFNGTVTCTFFNAFEFFDDIHTLDDFTEDCVVHVQPGSCCGSDEKLAAVGVRTCVSHGENACFIEI